MYIRRNGRWTLPVGRFSRSSVLLRHSGWDQTSKSSATLMQGVTIQSRCDLGSILPDVPGASKRPDPGSGCSARTPISLSDDRAWDEKFQKKKEPACGTHLWTSIARDSRQISKLENQLEISSTMFPTVPMTLCLCLPNNRRFHVTAPGKSPSLDLNAWC